MLRNQFRSDHASFSYVVTCITARSREQSGEKVGSLLANKKKKPKSFFSNWEEWREAGKTLAIWNCIDNHEKRRKCSIDWPTFFFLLLCSEGSGIQSLGFWIFKRFEANLKESSKMANLPETPFLDDSMYYPKIQNFVYPIRHYTFLSLDTLSGK